MSLKDPNTTINLEIERKFLINPKEAKLLSEILGGIAITAYGLNNVQVIRQGYLSTADGKVTRIRVTYDKRTGATLSAFLTVKGSGLMSRIELESRLEDVDVAEKMLDIFCHGKIIEKTRFVWNDSFGKKWEIDFFAGENDGLVMAEVELDNISEEITIPSFIGKEVTQDKRYSNMSLAFNPVNRENAEADAE